MNTESKERDRLIIRVLLIEGLANVVVLLAKLAVGITTQSTAILGDAVHSLSDLANNGMAIALTRISAAPPDADHPYGHRKFESLAVFVLATLLSVMAIEIALRAIARRGQPVAPSDWGLVVMLGVLAVNIAVAAWQNIWARRLGSEILRADALHTLGDVLTTSVVIVGWQLAARGLPILDMVFALLVSGLVLYLAFGLFRRAVPVLVDEAGVDDERLRDSIQSIPGVEETTRVRSRAAGSGVVADVVIRVDGQLSTDAAHDIADEIETRLAEDLGIRDVTVHIEPKKASTREESD